MIRFTVLPDRQPEDRADQTFYRAFVGDEPWGPRYGSVEAAERHAGIVASCPAVATEEIQLRKAA